MTKIQKVMIDTAKNFAKLSHCERLKVGAVLAKDKRIIACGYNGTISGTKNICEKESYICSKCGSEGKHLGDIFYVQLDSHTETKCKSCSSKEFKRKLTTNDFVLHAEQNVLTFCNREGLSTKDCDMYITHAPCKMCAKLIASAGIKNVYYLEDYRDLEGINFLRDLNIKVEKLK